MMGWRVGYIAYPGAARRGPELASQLLKVQDTIPICPPQLSQLVALVALEAGRPWVEDRLHTILPNRHDTVAHALQFISVFHSSSAAFAPGEGMG